MLILSSDTPEVALTKINNEFKKAATDKHHKFRFFSLSTIDPDNNDPHARMVVLRSFYDDGSFELFTDHRTQKVDDLMTNPNVAALFWDPSKNIQVRIQGSATVHHQTERTKKEWESIQGVAQKAYTPLIKPGTPIHKPEEAHQWPEEMTDEHFTIIHCVPHQIQVLQLQKAEHLALNYQKNSTTHKWEGSWTAP